MPAITPDPPEILKSLPEPDAVRRLLARNLREGRLLRQLLRTAERAADLRKWTEDGEADGAEEMPP